jgi:hypothetical protein
MDGTVAFAQPGVITGVAGARCADASGRAAGAGVERSAFAGFRFPPEVITIAVRWYLRYGLSYRDEARPLFRASAVTVTQRCLAHCRASRTTGLGRSDPARRRHRPPELTPRERVVLGSLQNRFPLLS